MPQLDKVTFFGQFFWLCIVFTGLYLILVKFCLPSIARILKVRESLLQHTDSATSFDESQSPGLNTQNILAANECFDKYQNLELKADFLANSNKTFKESYSSNNQKAMAINIFFSGYGRAKGNQTVPQLNNLSKGSDSFKASQLFYLTAFKKI
jgi:hypothetical protein